jgi:hypothetical protein
MRILLDECIPIKLGKYLKGHEVSGVTREGWKGLENGNLLKVAQSKFEIFLTVDRNLSYQQSVGKFDIALVVMHCYSNRVDDLLELLPELALALSNARPGTTTVVGT